LENRQEPSSRRKRGFKKALKQGLEIRDGAPFIDEIWRVLAANLDKKHGVKPVHSSGEISYLQSLFPENIKFVAGLLNAQVVAGVTLFVTPTVMHAQYIASSETGYEVCALDALLEHCVEKAKELGVRFFDFGVSTEEEGRYLNQGLNQFKLEFGGGGVVHEFYELSLQQ
jgi:lipid II:glycine glycyltransferase (peptidoglycan interpeptide bridge formation enzyme)